MDADRRLVRFAKSGNNAAFGKLVRKYRGPVLSLAFDYLRDFELAKETAQDVFTIAYRNINEFEEKSLFSTWLYRIAVDSALDLRKTQKKHKPIRDAVWKTSAAQVIKDRPQPFLNLNEKMLRALDRLSDLQYTAIVLRYFNHQSIREIAEILVIRESTVRMHLHQALQKLQTERRKGRKA